MSDGPERPTSEWTSAPIPEGLEGERIDSALARLFGFSRSRAADLIGQGAVTVDGVPPLKSERVTAGALVEVALPPVAAAAADNEPVSGLTVLFDDEDVVVVDKPVGVAVHPSPGWSGLHTWARPSDTNASRRPSRLQCVVGKIRLSSVSSAP